MLEQASESFKIQVVREDENGDEMLSIDKIQADQSPVIKLVDTTIFNALERRASDIHIETRDQEVAIKYRIDGVLHYAMPPIAKDWHSTIISRIKVMRELDIAERRMPQDGRFRVRYKGRLDRLPRLDHADRSTARTPCSACSTRESMSEKFSKLLARRGGLRRDRSGAASAATSRSRTAWCWSPGPTGSGKTTTLYAALSEIKNDEDKIITIEDPVEYQLKGITQIPVNEKKGLTFARGLRSILRHDPDKIMVGEIRDQETAQIAINAALTGHLVFTTVHANNVLDVLGRFLNMGVEPYNFVSALNCILAQRLVRMICEHCKREVRAIAGAAGGVGLDPKRGATCAFYEGAGCFECGGTGFRGRTAIHELLDLSERIREMILDKRPSAEIKRAAREEGMTFLRESARRTRVRRAHHAAGDQQGDLHRGGVSGARGGSAAPLRRAADWLSRTLVGAAAAAGGGGGAAARDRGRAARARGDAPRARGGRRPWTSSRGRSRCRSASRTCWTPRPCAERCARGSSGRGRSRAARSRS